MKQPARHGQAAVPAVPLKPAAASRPPSEYPLGAILISILITLAFVAVVFVLLVRPVALPEAMKEVTLIVLGQLSAAFMVVVNYWLGTSRASQVKDSTIQAMSATAGVQAATGASQAATMARRD